MDSRLTCDKDLLLSYTSLLFNIKHYLMSYHHTKPPPSPPPPPQYICVSISALKKLGIVGRHNILFYRNILYRILTFDYIFFHFSANLTISCSQFIIKYLRSEQKPRYGRKTWNTHISFFLGLKWKTVQKWKTEIIICAPSSEFVS